MKHQIIQVYKVHTSNGDIAFESRSGNQEETGGTETLPLLAKMVKCDVMELLKAGSAYSQVFIVFHPQHDMECSNRLAPRLCIPLTKKERTTFWDAYNKALLVE